jgi:hypothetical protein
MFFSHARVDKHRPYYLTRGSDRQILAQEAVTATGDADSSPRSSNSHRRRRVTLQVVSRVIVDILTTFLFIGSELSRPVKWTSAAQQAWHDVVQIS